MVVCLHRVFERQVLGVLERRDGVVSIVHLRHGHELLVSPIVRENLHIWWPVRLSRLASLFAVGCGSTTAVALTSRRGVCLGPNRRGDVDTR